MTQDLWAPVMRLYAQHGQTRNDAMKNAYEEAIDHHIEAIARGVPRVGTDATVLDNYRRRERRRRKIEALIAPLVRTTTDPRTELDRRLDLTKTLRDVNPASRHVLMMRVVGFSFSDIAYIEGQPVGTLKARMSRTMARIAA